MLKLVQSRTLRERPRATRIHVKHQHLVTGAVSLWVGRCDDNQMMAAFCSSLVYDTYLYVRYRYILPSMRKEYDCSLVASCYTILLLGKKPKVGVSMPFEPFIGTLNVALGKSIPGPLSDWPSLRRT